MKKCEVCLTKGTESIVCDLWFCIVCIDLTNYGTKHYFCFCFREHFTKHYHNVPHLQESHKMTQQCLIFLFSSGSNEKRYTRQWLWDHCPETGRNPAVVRGHPGCPGAPSSGTQTCWSALPSWHLPDQRCTLFRLEPQQISPLNRSEKSLKKRKCTKVKSL